MGYIGVDINYGNVASQTGVGNGTTTPIAALTYSVPTSSSIMVTLDGVTQVPVTDYVAVGTTLTFDSAVASPIAILVYFLGRSLDIGTPAAGTVTNASVDASAAIATSKLSGAVTSIPSHGLGALASLGSVDTGQITANAVDETKLKDALISDFSDVTVTASDAFLYGDATDSGNTKKDTIQGILDLASSGATLGTPVASTSGTSIDFTSIPSGTKRITISYSGVSTSGTSKPIVQLGDAGGVETSGYLGAGFRNGATVANLTDGFGVHSDWSSSVIFHGITILTLLDSSTFTWSSGSVMGRSDATHVGTGGGSKSLSAELDRVRFTTQGGSETFDAGKINILYE